MRLRGSRGRLADFWGVVGFAGVAAMMLAGILMPAAAQQDAQSEGQSREHGVVAGAGEVTAQRILEAAKHPQDWITYSGDYFGERFSPLKQITTANVGHLAPAGGGICRTSQELAPTKPNTILITIPSEP